MRYFSFLLYSFYCMLISWHLCLSFGLKSLVVVTSFMVFVLVSNDREILDLFTSVLVDNNSLLCAFRLHY